MFKDSRDRELKITETRENAMQQFILQQQHQNQGNADIATPLSG